MATGFRSSIIRPVEPDAAEAFTEQWVTAWNDHDLDGLLSHFADDAVFTSLYAAQLIPESGGVVRGKDALRRYWGMGLQRRPDLHFEVLGTYVGVNTVVINFRNQRGGVGCEVLTFADGVVVEGRGTWVDGVPYRSAE